MEKPVNKDERYLNNQRMYNDIRFKLLDMYELEKNSKYIEAVRIIDLGLGFSPRFFSINNDEFLKELATFIGNKEISEGRIFDSEQLTAIDITRKLENNYKNEVANYSGLGKH